MKAPTVAQYLVQEILTYSKENLQPEVQGSKELDTSTTTKRSSKRKKQPDRSYRLPKSFRTQPDISQAGVEDLHEVSSVSSQVSDELAICQFGHDVQQSSDSIVTDRPLSKCEEDIRKIIAEEVPQGVALQEAPQGQSADDSSMPSRGSKLALHQLEATYSSDGAKGSTPHRRPSVTLGESIEYSQDALHPRSPSEAEHRKTALPEIEGKASDAQAPSATLLPRGRAACDTLTGSYSIYTNTANRQRISIAFV